MRRSPRWNTGVVLAVVGLIAATAGAAGNAPSANGWSVSDFDRQALQRSVPFGALASTREPARTSSTWCGTASQQDQTPNAIAGNPVHWLYVTPSDGQDRFSSYSSAMQTDAELIDSWWRGQDPTRTLRSDLAEFSCGLQLDLSTTRLSRSGSLLDSDSRFSDIVDGIIGLGFRSSYVKYVVYYDGPISNDNLCGQGGSDSSGFGVAVVYVQSCSGIAASLVAAHELIHTLGAVPNGAPHNCPPPNDGHTCDNTRDIMYPFVDQVPLSNEILDPGRDDYYGHSGSWLDVQDSPWLVQLDRQIPLALTITGPGSVTADVPGLRCSQSCTTTWNANTQLVLTPTPGSAAKLVRWTGACSGAAACRVTVAPGTTASALFAPLTYRLTVSLGGRGTIRSSRAGISCRPRCSSSFASYVPLRISAKPAKGWRFSSWKGACRGSRSVCTVPMSTNTSARAIFAKV
jgi:hypothetical protein